MTDFSQTLIRCSSIGMIMTDAKGKTNLDKYNDAVELLSIERQKYDEMTNKSLKTAQKKLEKIQKLEFDIHGLEKVKDDVILSETCKSYLIQSYVLSKYGRVREVQTKQMVKGTISEQESIDLFAALEIGRASCRERV